VNLLLHGAGLVWRTLEGALPFLARPDDTWACQQLPMAARPLYLSMDRRDRAHAVRVARRVERSLTPEMRAAPLPAASDMTLAQGLLAAALLHDVGKAERPYRVVERVLVHLYLPPSAVAARFPRALQALWRAHRAHPERGAQQLTRAGLSPTLVGWVADHHRRESVDPMAQLLARADQGP
jgi:hypothetical protein